MKCIQRFDPNLGTPKGSRVKGFILVWEVFNLQNEKQSYFITDILYICCYFLDINGLYLLHLLSIFAFQNSGRS